MKACMAFNALKKYVVSFSVEIVYIVHNLEIICMYTTTVLLFLRLCLNVLLCHVTITSSCFINAQKDFLYHFSLITFVCTNKMSCYVNISLNKKKKSKELYVLDVKHPYS